MMRVHTSKRGSDNIIGRAKGTSIIHSVRKPALFIKEEGEMIEKKIKALQNFELKTASGILSLSKGEVKTVCFKDRNTFKLHLDFGNFVEVAADGSAPSESKRPSKVFVVGGGPSLQGFDFSLLSNEFTIITNKSILHTPNPNYFISVDYTFLGKIDRLAFKSNSATKVFVADFSYPFLKEINGQIIDTRSNLVYELDDFDIVVRAHEQGGIGRTFKEFRTGRNSGFCALQLAVILGFEEIYLLGVDLCFNTCTHYHEGYGESEREFNKKLEEYYHFFVKGIKELKKKSLCTKIYSCSPTSKLNTCIPFCSVEEVLKWKKK